MGLYNEWVLENTIFIIQAKSTLLIQKGGLIQMKYVWQTTLQNKGQHCSSIWIARLGLDGARCGPTDPKLLIIQN